MNDRFADLYGPVKCPEAVRDEGRRERPAAWSLSMNVTSLSDHAGRAVASPAEGASVRGRLSQTHLRAIAIGVRDARMPGARLLHRLAAMPRLARLVTAGLGLRSPHALANADLERLRRAAFLFTLGYAVAEVLAVLNGGDLSETQIAQVIAGLAGRPALAVTQADIVLMMEAA
ncbi:hypothetical protein CV103_20935 [Sphingomonas fennica]|uniref:Uncharacterized protein n=2 Tax=Edaphosphingomonas fennica TaxID=114404 RepID=A0A2T4HJU0_9SPHN|nr:hypothetical protein CV103_20935 [Sphingomonas fennica]